MLTRGAVIQAVWPGIAESPLPGQAAHAVGEKNNKCML